MLYLVHSSKFERQVFTVLPTLSLDHVHPFYFFCLSLGLRCTFIILYSSLQKLIIIAKKYLQSAIYNI